LSILAGCDFVFEISHAALLKQLRSVPLVGGQTLQTPFELTVPGKLGAAHVMVDEVLVDLNQDNTVTITFVFARSSLTSKDKPPKSLYPLSGRLTVNLRVVLFPTIPSPPVSTVQTLALDFAHVQGMVADPVGGPFDPCQAFCLGVGGFASGGYFLC